MLRTGYCAACANQTWRFVRHPQTGGEIPMWPRPDSRYLIYRLGNGSIANAIGVCPCFTAEPGAPLPVAARAQMMAGAILAVEHRSQYTAEDLDAAEWIGVQTAHQRYAAWYVPPFRDHMQAWLRDFIHLNDEDIRRWLAMWDEDRLCA